MTWGAPFVTLNLPSLPSTHASLLFLTGSQGMNFRILYSFLTSILSSIASSIASPPSDAREANFKTSSSLNPKAITFPTLNLFSVRVPVLSEQRTSTPASSSIATSFLTIASLLARFIAPTAIVTDKTAGSAAGIAATIKTRENLKISNRLSCLLTANRITTKITATARTMR